MSHFNRGLIKNFLPCIAGIIILAALALVVWMFVQDCKPATEGFGDGEGYSSSALSHIGGISDIPKSQNNYYKYPTNYDLMSNYGSQYNPFFPYPNTEDFTAEKTKFPVLNNVDQMAVGTYDPIGGAKNNLHKSANEKKTIDRLDRTDPSIIPKTSANVTPYNLDVADPTTYTFQVHAPRVIRKDKLAQQADPFRGDIPISIYPDVPIIHKSQYDRDSLRMDGFFSEALAKNYDRLTGKNQMNMPMIMSQGGMVMDM